MQMFICPCTDEFCEFPRGRQSVVWHSEMKIQAFRTRVEGETHNRVCNIINRHDVHA